MNALSPPTRFITEDEYLASEELSEVKREYLGGIVREMAGASESHGRLATKLTSLLDAQLAGKRCEFFGSDLRLRIAARPPVYYYYPDGMITCDPLDNGKAFRERPTVIFEILSESTGALDERKKRRDYHNLASLQAYVRIEQERREVVVERRTAGSWATQRFTGLEAVAEIGILGLTLPLAQLYARVVFPG